MLRSFRNDSTIPMTASFSATTTYANSIRESTYRNTDPLWPSLHSFSTAYNRLRYAIFDTGPLLVIGQILAWGSWLILTLKRFEPVPKEEQVEPLYLREIGSLQKPLRRPLPITYSIFKCHAVRLKNDGSLRKIFSAVRRSTF